MGGPFGGAMIHTNSYALFRPYLWPTKGSRQDKVGELKATALCEARNEIRALKAHAWLIALAYLSAPVSLRKAKPGQTKHEHSDNSYLV